MSFIAFLKENRVILDGGMGTLLQAAGLKPGEHPELWCVTRPEIVTGIHRAYFEAGSNLVCTNTFGANCLKFDDSTLREMIFAGVKCARDAAEGKKDRFVALDIGPTGKLLAPTGTLPFEDAVEIFAKTVRLGVEAGVDAILIETMTDSYETKAALLAAKENSTLPVLVTNAYGSDGKLMTGATPAAMVAMLEGMGVCALGANCSLGPKQLVGVAKELLEHASVPVILKPNAGLPAVREGKTVYDVTPEDFAEELAELVKAGVRLAGGCCGTTPAYIAALTEKTKALPVLPVTEKQFTTVSSYTHAVKFGEKPLLIGERINPTGKKRLKQALLEGDMNYLLEQGIAQVPEGRRVFADMTVLENLKIGAYLRKDKDEIEKDIQWVYSLFPRLQERHWQLAGTLSGGEQQMLAVGRALMSRPKVLMMDEPSLGLAPLVVQGIFEIIRTINQQGVTVLLIEQNANMALKVADIAYVLETGEITKTGTGAELLADESIKEAYLGKKKK